MKAVTFSMTLLSFIIINLALVGCNSEATMQAEASNEAKLSRVEQVLSDGVSNHDYRLYGLAGRRVVLPGFESENFDEIKKRCGVKLLSGTGDVLKDSQDRTKRRLNYQFALKVNQQIYALCLKNKIK